MLRVVSAALRAVTARVTSTNVINTIAPRCRPVLNYTQHRDFGALSAIVQKRTIARPTQHKILLNYTAVESLPSEPISVPVRSVTKFSLRKGKRKTVKAVVDRFYRLNWGIWIRTKAGRTSKLWAKSSARKKRLRQHVFCNATQSTLLDKMVTKYWRRPHYYVDDPYNPYHEREEFDYTRRRPLP